MWGVNGKGINDAFQSCINILIDKGQPVVIDGGTNDKKDCVELTPFVCEIENAQKRTLICPHRGNNPFATLYETVWVIAGESDITYLEYFLPRCRDFVDPHIQPNHWRAAYGRRLRKSAGFNDSVGFTIDEETRATTCNVIFVDQIKYVYTKLKQDPASRQAVMTIWDPAKECTVERTNDFPCSNHVAFLIRNGALNCTLTMRSNDVMWGFSGINVYEFTVIQEILAKLLGVRVGKFTHFVNSFHYYKNCEEKLKRLSKQEPIRVDDVPVFEFPIGEGYDNTMQIYERLLARVNAFVRLPTSEFLITSGAWLKSIIKMTEVERYLCLFILNKKRQEIGAGLTNECYTRIMRSLKDTDLKYSTHFWMCKDCDVFEPDELVESNKNMDTVYGYKEK
jgi:thymidylate synthase